VGFVVAKAALWQVFSEYFSFSCQTSVGASHGKLPHITLGWYNRPIVASVIVDSGDGGFYIRLRNVNLVAPHPKRKKWILK
jgi:hypothetical protein